MWEEETNNNTWKEKSYCCNWVEALIDKYYSDNAPLRHILLTHSQSVAAMALDIVHRHPELGADETFVGEAAMLHDIGIFRTDAPGIQCFGTEPYICHGLLGAELLRAEGYPRHARVAERHTGTGLTVETIQRQQLPLPLQDFSPETIEEQIICYADKFFSKSHLERVRTPEQVLHSLQKFGEEGVRRVETWIQRFA
ncbi:MAG: HDIG domain-containing protein [Bacteroidaceae bacterium]|nr:HDIG domain-containing protein [Bacteroidaceae bacterium]